MSTLIQIPPHAPPSIDFILSAEEALDKSLNNIKSDDEMSGDESNTFISTYSKGNLKATDIKSMVRFKDPTVVCKAILKYRTSFEMLKKCIYNDYEAKHLVMFWQACEGLFTYPLDDFRVHIKSIYKQFLKSNALQRVSLSESTIQNVKLTLHQGGDLKFTLFKAQNEAFYKLLQTTFPRFQQTPMYQSLLSDPVFIGLCISPPPPPGSVCSGVFSLKSTSKISSDSNSSTPEVMNKGTRHDKMRSESNQPLEHFHSQKANFRMIFQVLNNKLEQEIDRRIQLTTEVRKNLKERGKTEEEIQESDWTDHCQSWRFISLVKDPSESNTNISKVVSENIDYNEEFGLGNESPPRLEPSQEQFQKTIKQFKIATLKNPLISDIEEINTSPTRASSDIFPLKEQDYENVQFNRFVDGLENQHSQKLRNKSSFEAAMQILHSFQSQKEKDSPINYAERQKQKKDNFSSYNNRSHSTINGSDINSVASLPLRVTTACGFSNMTVSSDLHTYSQSQIAAKQVYPRYRSSPAYSQNQHYNQNKHSSQQQNSNNDNNINANTNINSINTNKSNNNNGSNNSKIKNDHPYVNTNELQIFYRVGESSDLNFSTRVTHNIEKPFFLRDFLHKVFMRRGNFRFHFKCWNSEIGDFVWEEVNSQDNALPLVEGKIFALAVPYSTS